MKRSVLSSHLNGIGGWLILLQVRIFAVFAGLLVMPVNTVLAILMVVMALSCLSLFYLRCIAFRTAYVCLAALTLASSVAALPVSVAYLAVQVVVEAGIVPALYKSRRVKETFFQCSDAAERYGKPGTAYGDGYHDMYLAAYRCPR